MVSFEKRIGLLMPSSNTTLEVETRSFSPESISVHAGRLLLEDVTYDSWMRMNQELKSESKKLATAGVNVIVFACTGASLADGLGYDRSMIKIITETTGLPSTTTSTAIIDALKHLGMRRLCVATPYSEEVTGKLDTFLKQNGFEIVKIQGMGIVSNLEIGRIPLSRTHEWAKQIWNPDADGLLISCTNLRTAEIINSLESELNRPVVTSNQASFWAALRMLEYKDTMKGFGKLFYE